ncbi:MAG: hypothetical protein ACK4RN_18055 [Pseudorhodobacter sp.]
MFAVSALLAQCAAPPHNPTMAAEEKALGTDGVIARYHALLTQPHTNTLSHTGFLIGIEKAPRSRIGLDRAAGYDTTRLRLPPPAGLESDSEQQAAHFRRVMAEPKAMFVSHVLSYLPAEDGSSIEPGLLYSAYSSTTFGRTTAIAPEAVYRSGWSALKSLETDVGDLITIRQKSGAPFTHIVLMAMGWNNDQFEAIGGYNALIHNARRAARSGEGGKPFRPLVIGITWPSVWGGTSVSDLANRALHIGSYGVKADDSDEIGYGIANHIVNAMLPRLEAKSGLPSVLIGHSMGARILTRAYFSRDILRDAVDRPGEGPLVIGLQGAFSANRFKSGYRLVPPVRWVVSGEGGPYQDIARPGGAMVLTWSRHDNANPFARLATGARHVGGSPGKTVMQDMEDKVQAHVWRGRASVRADCAAVRTSGKVLYVDASEIVKSHGDIANPEVGGLVWEMIDCLRPARSR